MPFKMMGKSPLMKKLVGNQHRLPEKLKQFIKDAPGKLMKKPSPNKQSVRADTRKRELDKRNDPNKEKSAFDKYLERNRQAAVERDLKLGYDTEATRALKKSKEKNEIKNKNQVLSGLPESKFGKIGADIMKQNQPNFSDTSESKPKESNIKKDTKKILDKKQKGESSVSLGDSKNISGRSANPSRLSSMIGKDNAVQAGRDARKATAVTPPKVPKTEVKNGKNKAKVDSDSKKRLPIDALQDRLTKNIDRRSRKADIRKQTRTAKKTSRQEKSGRLGINPNTGKSFTSAKQKQDFINNRSDKKKSNTNQTSNPFSKEQQKQIRETAAALGFGKVSTSSAATPKKKKVVKTPNPYSTLGVKTSNIDAQGIISKGRKASDKVASESKKKLKKDYDTKL